MLPTQDSRYLIGFSEFGNMPNQTWIWGCWNSNFWHFLINSWVFKNSLQKNQKTFSLFKLLQQNEISREQFVAKTKAFLLHLQGKFLHKYAFLKIANKLKFWVCLDIISSHSSHSWFSSKPYHCCKVQSFGNLVKTSSNLIEIWGCRTKRKQNKNNNKINLAVFGSFFLNYMHRSD